MIARHEAQREQTTTDVWARLAAPLPPGVTAWRQDGRPTMRDGRFFARFVSYIDANTVRERLDSVVPGEWNLTLDVLPPLPGTDDEQLPEQSRCAFKARLQILGVVREDVGTGKDYKQAATDAFKRVAVRFGIGHELYAMGTNWVQVDGDGRFAKPVEDPQVAYERRHARRGDAPVGDAHPHAEEVHASHGESAPAEAPAPKPKRQSIASDVPPCPKCGGRMWDNRLGKRNPKAPDFKCRDRTCDGVIWPPKPARNGAPVETETPVPAASETAPLQLGSDDIPF